MEQNTPIPDHLRRDKITGVHRWPLLGALAMPLLALVVVSYTQLTQPAAPKKTVTIAEARDLVFHDRPGGIVEVRDAKTDAVLRSFTRGKGAFLRQSMRALITTRRRKGLNQRAPYRVQRDVKGMLTIMDPLSGTSISLNAFGAVALENYGPLLDQTVGTAPKAQTTSENQQQGKGA
ncbi:MAG: photosynthetic complex assembly protein PuhC [Pseudomonadota bacterium]